MGNYSSNKSASFKFFSDLKIRANKWTVKSHLKPFFPLILVRTSQHTQQTLQTDRGGPQGAHCQFEYDQCLQGNVIPAQAREGRVIPKEGCP